MNSLKNFLFDFQGFLLQVCPPLKIANIVMMYFMSGIYLSQFSRPITPIAMYVIIRNVKVLYVVQS